MYVNISQCYEPKIFEMGQIAKAIKHSLNDHSIDATEISYTLYSDLGSRSKSRLVDFDELTTICKLDKQISSIYFSYADHTPHPNVIGLDTCKGFLKLIINADNPETGQNMINVFEQDLGLKAADERLLTDRDLEQELDALTNRVAIMEERLARQMS